MGMILLAQLHRVGRLFMFLPLYRQTERLWLILDLCILLEGSAYGFCSGFTVAMIILWEKKSNTFVFYFEVFSQSCF